MFALTAEGGVRRPSCAHLRTRICHGSASKRPFLSRREELDPSGTEASSSSDSSAARISSSCRLYSLASDFACFISLSRDCASLACDSTVRARWRAVASLTVNAASALASATDVMSSILRLAACLARSLASSMRSLSCFLSCFLTAALASLTAAARSLALVALRDCALRKASWILRAAARSSLIISSFCSTCSLSSTTRASDSRSRSIAVGTSSGSMPSRPSALRSAAPFRLTNCATLTMGQARQRRGGAVFFDTSALSSLPVLYCLMWA